jgi:hypothetical protein
MSRRADRAALRRRLDALAAQPVASIDPETLDAGEARLRAIYDLHDGHAPRALETSVPGPTVARNRRAALGSLAVASVAIAALGAFAALRDDATSTEIQLTAARGAYIVLPDGSRIVATAGATIPEGGQLVVDGDGSVTIDGVVVGPGETATVEDGELRIGVSTTAATDARPGATQSSVPTTDAGTDDTSPSPTTHDSPPTTAPRSTTTSTPATTTSVPPTTAPPTTVPPREIVRLPGGARVIDGVVRIRWDAYSGEDFAGYLVLARLDGERPRPGQVGTIVVLRSRDRTQTIARTPFSPGMSIRVVAVDADKKVVASTRVLHPTLEPRADPTTTTAPPTTIAGLAAASTTTPGSASPTLGTAAVALALGARTRVSRRDRAVRE